MVTGVLAFPEMPVSGCFSESSAGRSVSRLWSCGLGRDGVKCASSIVSGTAALPSISSCDLYEVFLNIVKK